MKRLVQPLVVCAWMLLLLGGIVTKVGADNPTPKIQRGEIVPRPGSAVQAEKAPSVQRGRLVTVGAGATVEAPGRDPSVLPPAITLAKTVGTNGGTCATTDTITVTVGTRVYYCYTVTNTGDVTFTQHTLTDTQLGPLLTGLSYQLTPGASAFLTVSTVLSQSVQNTAFWTAYNGSPTGPESAQATDTATVVIERGAIVLDKTVGTNPAVCATTDAITVTAGTVAVYCYTVTNTGSDTLWSHTLTDTHLGPILEDFSYTLPPGASAFLTVSTSITMNTVNIGFWTAGAEVPGGTLVARDNDSATVTIGVPTALRHALLSDRSAIQSWSVLPLLAGGLCLLLWRRRAR